MPRIKNAIIALELPVLLFPVIATCIVAGGFICGCECSVWMWWSSLCLSLIGLWYRCRNVWAWSLASAMFIAFLLFFWIFANTTAAPTTPDSSGCHFTAVRMLGLGWNPIWQATPDEIAAALAIDPSECSIWHIISMPKGVWYFNAVAYKFTKAHFNLNFPLSYFITVSMFYAVYSFMRRYGKVAAVSACGIALCILIKSAGSCSVVVDRVIALSAIGLLVTMVECLRDRTCQFYPRLFTFTFWMLVAKPSGTLHCIIFWIIFFAAIGIDGKVKCFKRSLIVAASSLVCFIIVCASPYVTSAMRYGHPLYPRYSGNEVAHPTKNLTNDFLCRNDDAAEMGHFWAYINAYVSPALVRNYYSFTTGKKDFCPQSQVWEQTSDHSVGSPTSLLYRILFFTQILLLMFCGKTGRFISICIIFGTLAMPTEMLGFKRYTPWALCGWVFLIGVAYRYNVKYLRVVCMCLSTALLAGLLFSDMFFCAIQIDRTYASMRALDVNPPTKIAAMTTILPEGNVEQAISRYRIRRANLVLAQRNVSAISRSTIVDYSGSEEDYFDWQYCYDGSFQVPADCKMKVFSKYSEVLDAPRGMIRYLAYVKFVVSTYSTTLPKSVCARLYGSLAL